jgi:hypothetical protein
MIFVEGDYDWFGLSGLSITERLNEIYPLEPVRVKTRLACPTGSFSLARRLYFGN